MRMFSSYLFYVTVYTLPLPWALVKCEIYGLNYDSCETLHPLMFLQFLLYSIYYYCLHVYVMLTMCSTVLGFIYTVKSPAALAASSSCLQ